MEPAGLQGILAFVQVVEAGSFTDAGRRLHVTKSAVGKSIAQLEQRLGVRLLNRTTRSLSPTSEGLGYYEACVRALSEIEAAQSLLAARRLVPSGRLRVDVPLAFGRRCVAPVLFLSLAARRIYAQRSAICAAPSYLEKHGRPRSIEDLANHSVIGYGRDSVVRPWTVRHADGHVGKFVPRARLVLGHGEPMLDAALAGCGIVFLPTWLAADSLKSGGLETVLSDCLVEDIVVHAVWPVTRSLTPKVRVVVDALIEHFSSPTWDAA
ncbi:MAG: LysR family transcriptional regulator [Mesorhizobium sp.]|nr:MAG: LysR family transcriptional regulator [Mesorhizobium sp.]